MKILATTPLVNINGESIIDQGNVVTIGSSISSILSMSQGETPSDTVRLYKIALEIFSKPEYEVNGDTVDFIIKYVEKSPLIAVIKGQLLTKLEEIKKQ